MEYSGKKFEAVSFRDFEWGCRTGHERDLRKWAVDKFGAEEVAILSSNEVEKKVIEAGLIPVTPTGYSADDGIFLIDRESLEKAIIISR